jgi:flagellar protein FliS
LFDGPDSAETLPEIENMPKRMVSVRERPYVSHNRLLGIAMNATALTKTYATVGVESGVAAADPHKLISMLYQGALLAIANAKNGMLRKDIPAKGSAISKAISIIGEGLNASLDKSVGGELVQNLSALYEYMNLRLLAANLKNDIEALDEVARLLGDLKQAWESIRQPGVGVSADMLKMPQNTAPADHGAGKPLSTSGYKGPTAVIKNQVPDRLVAPIPVAQQSMAGRKVQMAYGRG